MEPESVFVGIWGAEGLDKRGQGCIFGVSMRFIKGPSTQYIGRELMLRANGRNVFGNQAVKDRE